MLKRASSRGMVSIMVTMVLMIVISLIVLGFAQVSRREQRAALDRQLSTQAFLAAESGVNDARRIAQQAIAAGVDIPEKSTCALDATNYPAPQDIDSANSVSYTCLLVTTRLKNININPVSAGKAATNFPLEPVTGSVSRIHVNWKALSTPGSQSDINNKCTKTGTEYFPSPSNWQCPYGVLRMDIVPTDDLSRTKTEDGQKTIFFYPVGTGGASVNWVSANGAVAPMNCTVAAGCDININGITGSGKYAVRVSSTYATGILDITAFSGPTQLDLKNAQIQIDVTGKAQDVLRRIQVRLPFTPGSTAPDYAIASGSSICKRFEITSTSFSIPNDIVGQDQNNPMCKTTSVGPVTPPAPCIASKDIMMLLDYSDSMLTPFGGSTRLAVLKSVAQRFVDRSGVSAIGNHEGLITFSKTPTLRSAFTTNATTLKSIINSTGNSSGTEFKVALEAAENVLKNHSSARTGAQKALLFFTDGNKGDTETNASIRAVADRLEAAGVDVYVIGIIDGDSDVGLLQYIVANNGSYASASSPSELQSIFDSIADEVTCN